MKRIFIILSCLVFLGSVAAGNASVLFEDDFEDGNRDGWTHIDSDEGPAAGQWIVVEEPSRGWVLEGTAPPYPQYLQLDLELPDCFVLEFEARTVFDNDTSASLFAFYVHWLGWGEGWIGIHRYRPSQPRSFMVNQSVLSCVQGQTRSQDTSVTPYQWHSFKLVKENDWYTLYYENNVVLEGWVSTGSACTDLGGSLVLGTSRSNITRYDNICISTISREVEIDIKPSSYPNSLNLKSKGVVPVAVLTTDDVDAYDIDPDTCLFADAQPLRWTMEDVDDDGDWDMLLHFRTQELSLTQDSELATLTGMTTDGTEIEGTDSVNIVPKNK